MSRRRFFFPIGLFLLLCVLFAGSAAGVLGLYAWGSLRHAVTDISEHTPRQARALLDACAALAETGQTVRARQEMARLLADNAARGVFRSGFFVAMDGTILAHSSAQESERLKNNIATDEFTYNIDQILYAARTGKKETVQADYFIMSEPVPFDKQQLQLLKQYLLPGIDRNGWLLSKAVYINNKPAGTVSVIVSKTPLYGRIHELIRATGRTGMIALPATVFLALLLSVLVDIRYRMIYRRALRDAGESPVAIPAREEEDNASPLALSLDELNAEPAAGGGHSGSLTPTAADTGLPQHGTPPAAPSAPEAEIFIDSSDAPPVAPAQAVILDAIPVSTQPRRI